MRVRKKKKNFRKNDRLEKPKIHREREKKYMIKSARMCAHNNRLTHKRHIKRERESTRI